MNSFVEARMLIVRAYQTAARRDAARQRLLAAVDGPDPTTRPTVVAGAEPGSQPSAPDGDLGVRDCGCDGTAVAA